MPEEGLSSIGLLAMTQEEINELEEEELDEAIDEAIDIFLTAPQFRTIREQIRNNPGSVQNLSDQLRQLNPAFHNLIMDNPAILEEILTGVNEFTEEQLENMEDEGDWQEVDESGNPVLYDTSRFRFQSLTLRYTKPSEPSIRRSSIS